MRVASWNVNSVRMRLPLLLDYLREQGPDVLCLQELKCMDEAFPFAEIEGAGYNVLVHGQKTFNGVAILSKFPLELAERGLPGDSKDTQARYLEAVASYPQGAVRVASIYLPNGNPVGTEKLTYKHAWMERLQHHAQNLLRYEEMTILAGDYNVIPEPADVYDPSAWAADALYLPQTRAHYRTLLNLGYADAFRAASDDPHIYTFWDYQAGAWQKNNGIRIDHLLLSPQAADRLYAVAIDQDMRRKEKPSDHVPIRADFLIENEAVFNASKPIPSNHGLIDEN